MKHIKLFLIFIISFSLFGCNKNNQYGQTNKNIYYENYLDDERYDSSLFYKNHGDIVGADPSVITVGDEYYLYITNADGSDCSFIQAYKSKNLMDWEWLGRVFVPNRDAWAISSLWAPEVVESNGKYYMYYSGFDINYQCMGIGLAVSDSPSGPFKEYDGVLNDGTKIDYKTSPFNFIYSIFNSSFLCVFIHSIFSLNITVLEFFLNSMFFIPENSLNVISCSSKDCSYLSL